MPVPADQRETLLRYLRVQTITDREITALLRQAARDLAVQIENIAPTSFSDSLRLAQLRIRQRAIAQELWSRTGNSITAGKDRATGAALTAGDRDIEKLLKRLDPGIRAALQHGAEKAAREAVGRSIARSAGRGAIDLSQRVYANQALMTGQVDRLINSGLARGLSPRELAREARQFILPSTPGGTSYAAMRLGRTEVNNSFHSSSAAYYQGNPFVLGMKWSLSGSHPHADVCNDYASEDHDRLGAGIFRTENVPPKPHPQCFCYVVPSTPDDDEIVRAFQRGEYDRFLSPERERVTLSESGPVSPSPSPSPGAAASAGQPVVEAPKRFNDFFGPDDAASLERKVDAGIVESRQLVIDSLERQGRYMGGPVMSRLRGVIKHKHDRPGVSADYGDISRRLRINPAALKNGARANSQLRKEVRQAWSSHIGDEVTALDHNLAHEMGHHLSNIVFDTVERKQELFDFISDEFKIPRPKGATEEVLQAWAEANRRVLGQRVSFYGASDPEELLAEIWAEFTRGGTNRRRGVGNIGRFMRDRSRGALP